ncbi:MAG TPA: hypothetical protein ACFYEL_07715, partial [Candidatus Wunengus californicus]|uniref:hypothetical protein n=1 Tax=Candidatus Wunengus californicus TaxID=3367619 RepID=UPI0040286164
LLYRPVYPSKSEIYEKRHVVCRNYIIQNGGCFHTAFVGSIPQRVQVCNLNPIVCQLITPGIQTGG